MNTSKAAARLAANCLNRQSALSPRAFHLLAKPPRRSPQLSRFSSLTSFQIDGSTARETQRANHALPLDTLRSESSASIQDIDVNDDEEDSPLSNTGNSAKKLEQTKRTFKTWMRTVPKSVAIIAARKQDIADSGTGTVAATVSSFNTVAFDPDIYVSFNLKQNSSTLKVILETKYFSVTFPENSKYGAALADRFAKGDKPPPTKEKEIAHYVPNSMNKKYFASLGVQYPPCVVSAHDSLQDATSGFAFGTWYEYQSSVTAGDHVVIIAKALPFYQWRDAPSWISKADSGDALFTSRTTLGHIHGRYTSQDGVSLETFKLDDKTRTTHEGLDKKAFYESRLEAISRAMSGVGRRSMTDEDNYVFKSMKSLPPEVQVKYQRYYMARLARLESRELSATEVLADIVTHLAPWEQLVVRQKKRMPEHLLEEEKSTCLRRLALLESDSYSFQETSQNDASDNELLEAVDDFPNDSPIGRLAGLRRYWRSRLRLLNIVTLSSIIDDSSEVKLHNGNIWHWIDVATDDIVVSRREWPLEMLISSREQYDRIVFHFQRTLMRAWSGSQGKVKDEFIQDMIQDYKRMLRISYALSWMVARRSHLDGNTAREALRPVIPDDKEIIAKTKDWHWSRKERDQLLKTVSDQLYEPTGKDMTNDEFQSLLTGIVGNIKERRQNESPPQQETLSTSPIMDKTP